MYKFLSLTLLAAVASFGDVAATKRQSTSAQNGTMGRAMVDLGYSRYQGIKNQTTGLNTFKGIRYAAPPTGSNRWQLPLPPTVNDSTIIPATDWPAQCPQAQKAPLIVNDCPGLENASTLPEECLNNPLFLKSVLGDEDCLYLNIWAPQGKSNLPVFVWIHGGADGFGNGRQDLSTLINANDNSFIGVTIQYRIGAFGFLASDEVARYGTVNAGLHDQNFALHWVQRYIGLFGGDPDRVTIGGQSVGAASVLQHGISYGGQLGNSLFKQGILASPYIPTQWHYRDFVPTQSYFSLASKVGCFDGTPFGNSSETVFQCLVKRDSLILQQASAIVDGTGRVGTWGMQTVTDDEFITGPPSQALTSGHLNGENMLIGTNADEGFKFTPQNIVTEDDLRTWLGWTFPLFSPTDIDVTLLSYASSDAPTDPHAPLFATTGTSGPTAINQSCFGTGQQQRANNINAEMIFHSPAGWAADAYAGKGKSYMYQYSVPPANHGFDLPGYFGDNANFGPPPPGNPYLSPDFMLAFMRIYGNFITTGNPAISNEIANGQSLNATSNSSSSNPASTWPAWDPSNPMMLNMNTTGGLPTTFPFTGPIAKPGVPPTAVPDYDISVPIHVYNGTASGEISVDGFTPLRNKFEVVSRWNWEGGRGPRDGFWRGHGPKVPE